MVTPTLTAALLILPGLALGYIYATAMEWVVHNLVYHKLGRALGGTWNFHLKEHHRDTRRGRGVDASFAERRWGWNAHGREAMGLALMVLLHLPLVLLSTTGIVTFATIAGMAVYYHYCHWKSHADPAWCRERLPWHWEHHMGRTLDANYCLTSDWFDRLMGTRVRDPACFELKERRASAAA